MKSKEEKETIAAFDFDGTITTKDTLFEFLKFTNSPLKLILGLLMMSPILVLHAFQIIPNYKAKQMLFSWFYRGWDLARFNEMCEEFAIRIDSVVNRNALDELKAYNDKGVSIVIVTASIENWVKPWATATGINEVLGTKIEVDSNNRITGRFLSKNCYGQEKVNRFLEMHPNRNTYKLAAYGDSRGDRELLAFADIAFLKKF